MTQKKTTSKIIINPAFELKDEDIAHYRKKGYLKLRKFFRADVIESLKFSVISELKASKDAYAGGYFSKVSYDILERNELLFRIFADNTFRSTVTSLNERSLFFTQGIGFQLMKNKDPGFPWHHGGQSFGYIRPGDFGCTIWTPLVEINKKQRGGMAYIPKNIVSADFMYNFIYPAITRYIKEKIESNEDITQDEILNLYVGVLNSSEFIKIFDYYKEEDNFELGDAFIFDKYVIHKSVRLNEGPIESRTAFVMRFVDVNARYDKQAAFDLDLPRSHFGKTRTTTFHLDVCKEDGEKISESLCFSDIKKRILKLA